MGAGVAGPGSGCVLGRAVRRQDRSALVHTFRRHGIDLLPPASRATAVPLYRRLYDWQSVANSPVQDAMARQQEYVRKEFDTRYSQVGARILNQLAD